MWLVGFVFTLAINRVLKEPNFSGTFTLLYIYTYYFSFLSLGKYTNKLIKIYFFSRGGGTYL